MGPDDLLKAVEALANAVRIEIGERHAPKPRKAPGQPTPPAPRGPSAYGREALRREADAVASAPEGTRNDTLNRAAFSIGTLIGGGAIDRATAEAELMTAARSCGLSDAEARRTIASGLGSGVQQPRQRPARPGGEPLGVTLSGLERRIGPLGPASDGDATAEPEAGPVLLSCDEIECRPVEWLWPQRIAMGKLTVWAGNGGLGKSTASLDVAARVTTGAGWPDDPSATGQPGGVIVLSAEDDAADTIVPRLKAHGADLKRVKVLVAVRRRGEDGAFIEDHVNLAAHLRDIEQAIDATPACRLLVIDPVTAYLGAVDDHRNAEVRGLLAPLSAMAAKHNIAMLCLTHLNKGGGEAIHRIIGSIAWAAAARTAMAFAKDRDDDQRRLVLTVKSNIAPEAAGLAYRLVDADGVGRVEWEPDPVSLTAEDALGQKVERGARGRTALDDAKAWLLDHLADGSRPAAEVIADAKGAGISRRTLDRAKAEAYVTSVKDGLGGPWHWCLPGASLGGSKVAKDATEDCQSPEFGNLRENASESSDFPREKPKVAKSRGLATFGGNLGDLAPPGEWTPEAFATEIVGATPQVRDEVIAQAKARGVRKTEAAALLNRAVAAGVVHQHRGGPGTPRRYGTAQPADAPTEPDAQPADAPQNLNPAGAGALADHHQETAGEAAPEEGGEAWV